MAVVGTPARATELHETVAADIIAAMARGCSIRTAAGLSGITGQAVLKWIAEGEREPDGRYGAFARAVRVEQAKQIEAAEVVFSSQRMEDPSSMRWWLSRMDRATYGDDPTVVVQQPQALPDATPEEVAAAIRGSK